MAVFGALVVAAGAAAFALFGQPAGRIRSSAGTTAGPGNRPGEKTEPLVQLAGKGSSTGSEMSARERVLSHIAGHLIAETVPPGATVWVDGVVKGKTFADVVVGSGIHRIVLTAPGYRMFRDDVDTGRGAIIRRNMVPVPPPVRGNGFIRVECQTVGQYPILVDDEETGLLCPSLQVPAAVGKHMVGVFLPGTRRVLSVGVTVEMGGKPAIAKFTE
jgi:hypothetical protein